jgi:hypothetical protein
MSNPHGRSMPPGALYRAAENNGELTISQLCFRKQGLCAKLFQGNFAIYIVFFLKKTIVNAKCAVRVLGCPPLHRSSRFRDCGLSALHEYKSP